MRIRRHKQHVPAAPFHTAALQPSNSLSAADLVKSGAAWAPASSPNTPTLAAPRRGVWALDAPRQLPPVFADDALHALLRSRFAHQRVRGDGSCGFYALTVALVDLAHRDRERIARGFAALAQATTPLAGSSVFARVAAHLSGDGPVEAISQYWQQHGRELLRAGDALRQLLRTNGCRHLRGRAFAADTELERLAQAFFGVHVVAISHAWPAALVQDVLRAHADTPTAYLLHSAQHFDVLISRSGGTP